MVPALDKARQDETLIGSGPICPICGRVMSYVMAGLLPQCAGTVTASVYRCGKCPETIGTYPVTKWFSRDTRSDY